MCRSSLCARDRTELAGVNPQGAPWTARNLYLQRRELASEAPAHVAGSGFKLVFDDRSVILPLKKVSNEAAFKRLSRNLPKNRLLISFVSK